MSGLATCRACGGTCCQGPLVLVLDGEEAERLTMAADALGLALRLRRGGGEGAQLRFPDHAGDRCPFLGDDLACRVYERRPGRCRAFPERVTEGCPLSEALAVRRPAPGSSARLPSPR